MYRFFSVDDHIVEPADVWTKRVSKKFADVMPRVIEKDGHEYWTYEDTVNPTMGLNAVAGKPRDQWGMDPVRFTDMIPGCYEPRARKADMLSQGIFASVNFPTIPRFGGALFTTFKDKELASECVSAWNDFVLDEWCAAAPEMFVPMVICQVWDPVLAAAEIERCLAKGAKALCFVENPAPLGLPSFHETEHWAPVMSLCNDAELPICMHIGSSGSSTIDPGMIPLVEIAAAFAQAARCAVNLMCADIPRRWENLRLVWSEGGIGWIPAAIERADRQWERHKLWTNHLDGLLPSEIAKRNMWFCMIEEPMGIKYRYDYGVDHILWESDYPHADTPFPNAQNSAKEVFEENPSDEVEKITHLNAESLFKFPLHVPNGFALP